MNTKPKKASIGELSDQDGKWFRVVVGSKPFGVREEDREFFLMVPVASTKSARKRLSFERLTFEEKVEAICAAGYQAEGVDRLAPNWKAVPEDTKQECRNVARAILALIQGDDKP